VNLTFTQPRVQCTWKHYLLTSSTLTPWFSLWTFRILPAFTRIGWMDTQAHSHVLLKTVA